MLKRRRNGLIGLILVGAGLLLGGFAVYRAADILSLPPTCAGPRDLPAGGTWTTGVPMPIPRAETAAAGLNGALFVSGGMGREWLASTVSEVYDPVANAWRAAAPMPVAVHHAGVATLGGRLYVIGGYDDMGKMVRAEPDIAQGWVYDPADDTWANIADMPAPRAAGALVEFEGRLFLLGGTGTGAQEVWVYDPATDTWDTSRAGRLPTPREHVPAVVLDDRLYVIGGRWKDVSTGANEVYDPATDTWTELASIPTPRSALSLAALHGRIHAVGGEDLDNQCTYGTHEVYDPATDTWTELASIPTPRHAIEAAVIDGKWYLVGGSMHSGGSTERGLTGVVEIFTPDTPATGG